MTTVGVVADVLNDAATICVAVRFAQLIRRGVGKALKQERDDLVMPDEVDDLLVRKNGVSPGLRWSQKKDDCYPNGEEPEDRPGVSNSIAWLAKMHDVRWH